jgi:predicted nucleic acid-binding protein
MTQIVVLDNEAVQALAGPHHPRHHRVLGYVELVERRKRRAASVSVLAPTAVRVEAGWDRNSPQWAFINRLRIVDVLLDAVCANKAAAIREQTQVSIADAHIGATVQSAPDGDIIVLTSDPGDLRGVAGGRLVTIVAI